MLSNKRNYPYSNVAGLHWPDAVKGSSTFYAIDLNCSVNIEKQTITEVNWFVPAGLVIEESFITDTNEAQVQISAHKAGYYEVRADIKSTDTGTTQTDVVVVNLKVI